MTKEDFEQWKDNSVTKEVMRELGEARVSYTEAIITHAKNGDDIQGAYCAGVIEAMDFLIKIQFEDQK